MFQSIVTAGYSARASVVPSGTELSLPRHTFPVRERVGETEAEAPALGSLEREEG